jgi:flagellar assembly protein FliH
MQDQGDVRVVDFDRPLQRHELGWADPRVAERIADIEKSARERAHSLGYAAGWAEGRKAAAERESNERAERERRHREQLQDQSREARELLASLAETVRSTRQAVQPTWEQAADLLVDGAIRLARAALARELTAVDDTVVDAVRVALRALDDPGEVQVQLNPGDLATANQLLEDQAPTNVRLVPDPEVTPGSVRTASSARRLLYDVPAALDRAEEAMRG